MASTIGIKIANGEFYSIVDENSTSRKRLVLTTVHDNQKSVQIDLYKSNIRTMADAFYIGTLVVERIKPRPRGEASIELVITSTEGGDITADAMDMDTSALGEHHTLHVSLTSLDDNNLHYEIPDFELEHDEGPPSGLFEGTGRKEKEKQTFPWLVLICIILVLIALGLAVWLFFFRDNYDEIAAARPVAQGSQNPVTSQTAASAPSTPAAPVQQSAAAEAPPPAIQAPVQTPPPAVQQPQAAEAPPPVISAPAQAPPAAAPVRRTRPVPPVASYRVPAVIPREGVVYRIGYGDTLWDIAEAFYRNPWLYPNIARFNNIRNPDLIYSGTTIRVPPKN